MSILSLYNINIATLHYIIIVIWLQFTRAVGAYLMDILTLKILDIIFEQF